MQISGLVFSGLTKDISGLADVEKFISAHPWTSAKNTENCISSNTAEAMVDARCSAGQVLLEKSLYHK
jgi:hypothetical protein